MRKPSTINEEDLSLLLDKAQYLSYLMKCSIDMNNMKVALKNSSNLFAELRNSSLTFKQYFEFFTYVQYESRFLYSYFEEEFKKGRNINNLYKVVQFSGNLIPRLYLVSTVAPILFQYFSKKSDTTNQFISNKNYKMKKILSNITHMAKGLQHPVKGLFFRYYLVKMSINILQMISNFHIVNNANLNKNSLLNSPKFQKSPRSVESKGYISIENEKLPEKNINGNVLSLVNEDSSGNSGNLVKAEDYKDDFIEFYLENLKEMCFYWKNIVHHESLGEDIVEEEKKQIKAILGENFKCLNNISNVNSYDFRTLILPKIFQIFELVDDLYIHEFLIEKIILEFPVEFHLTTLSQILDRLERFASYSPESYNYYNIFVNRITNYGQCGKLQKNESATKENESNEASIGYTFTNIYESINNLNNLFASRDYKKLIDISYNFIKLNVKCYPNNPEFVNKGFELIENTLSFRDEQVPTDCQKLLLKVLIYTIDEIAISLLAIKNFHVVVEHLNLSYRRLLAKKLINSLVNLGKKLLTEDDMAYIFRITDSIINESLDDSTYLISYEFTDDQATVAQMPHLIECKDLTLIQKLKSKLILCSPHRLHYYIPPLIFYFLKKLKSENKYQIELMNEIEYLLEILLKNKETQIIQIYSTIILTLNNIKQNPEVWIKSFNFTKQLLDLLEGYKPNDEMISENLSVIISTIIFNLPNYLSKDISSNTEVNTNCNNNNFSEISDRIIKCIECVQDISYKFYLLISCCKLFVKIIEKGFPNQLKVILEKSYALIQNWNSIKNGSTLLAVFLKEFAFYSNIIPIAIDGFEFNKIGLNLQEYFNQTQDEKEKQELQFYISFLNSNKAK